MHNKPTYWDSCLINLEGFIKTNDGQYFKVERNKAVKRISQTIHYLFLILPFCILWIETKLWPNLIMEFLLAVILTHLGIEMLDYRLTRFYPVYEGSHEYDVARSGAHPRRWGLLFGMLFYAITIAAIVFLLLNSYCAMLLRSIIGQSGKITQATADVGGHYINSVMEISNIPLNETMTLAEIDFTIANTPQTAEFSLNGKPIAAGDIKRNTLFNFIWDENYLTCKYDVYLPEVRNGSILTIDCGNLHHEWTFRIEPEN